MSETKQDKREAPASPFATDEELNAAREATRMRSRRMELDHLAIGTVIGLPDGQVANVFPPDFPEAKRVPLRAKWASRGYVRAKTPVEVVGYNAACEVWTAERSDWRARRADFARRRIKG